MPTFLTPVSVVGPAANGLATIGTNTTTAAGGLWFGTDTSLFRSGVGTLRTDSVLQAYGMNSSNTAAFGANGGVVVRNLNVTANNWTQIDFQDGSGTITAGLAVRNIDQTGHYGETSIYGRSPSGFRPRLRIPNTGGLEVYGDASAVVATVTSTGFVGLGTTTPASRLSISQGDTDPTVVAINGASALAISKVTNYTTTELGTTTSYGVFVDHQKAGVGAATTSVQNTMYLRALTSGGDINASQALVTQYRNTGAGVVAFGAGIRADPPAQSGGGSITEGVGFYVANQGMAGMTLSTGVRVLAQSGATSSNGLTIGAAQTATLWLSDTTASTTPSGGIVFGNAKDTNLYRSAADTLKTDDSFIVGGNLTVTGTFSLPATSVVNTPAGGIAATTVQAAVNELDTEKAPIDAPVFTTSAQVPRLGVNVAPSVDFLVAATGTITGSAAVQGGGSFDVTLASPATTGRGLRVKLTAGAGYALSTAQSIYVLAPTLDAGASLTTAMGMAIQANSVGANVYGVQVGAQTGSTAGYGITVAAASTQTLWLGYAADSTTVTAGIAFGLSRDTNLYRSAADTLKTDDNFIVGGDLTVTGSIAGGTSFLSAAKWGVD